MEARTLRLFLGLPLPLEASEALGRWQREWPDIKGWSRAAGLHLTLAFLGARGAEALPVLRFTADRLALFESRPQGCYAPLRTWRLGEV